MLNYVAGALVSRWGPTADASFSDPVRECGICSTPFRSRSLQAYEVYAAASTEFCTTCLSDANGLLIDDGSVLPWVDAAHWAVRAATLEFGGPPSLAQLEAPLRGTNRMACPWP